MEPEAIPILASDPMIAAQIEVGGMRYTGTAVSIGNPHLVVNSKDIDKLNLKEIGPEFENHPLFPEHVNTEFVEQIDKTTLRMRVWERGSGETMACGTGACAAVVAFAMQGMVERNVPITVKLLGGDLRIVYSDNGHVLMSGTATEVFRGEIEI